MAYAYCPTCRKFDDLRHHTCPPAWHIVNADWDDDESHDTIYAETAAQAAEDFLCQNHGDFDYPSEMAFKVRPASGGAWEVYDVDVRSEPVFEARKRRAGA